MEHEATLPGAAGRWDNPRQSCEIRAGLGELNNLRISERRRKAVTAKRRPAHESVYTLVTPMGEEGLEPPTSCV